jgi:DNA-binding GntR family transcriptional regulator
MSNIIVGRDLERSMPVEPRGRNDVKVANGISDVLRRRILSGDVAPGQRLIEADLVGEFEVSRSAVREAFIQLDAEGLVELRHQRGASVTRLSRKELADLFVVRERLEGLAAFLAAEHAGDPANRAWLEAQRGNWMRAVMIQNERTHMDENVPLHEGIVRMSGNERLAEVLRRLQAPFYRQRFLDLLDEDRRHESVEDHLLIIDALLAGDGAKAEELMRLHVRRAGSLAQQIVGLD